MQGDTVAVTLDLHRVFSYRTRSFVQHTDELSTYLEHARLPALWKLVQPCIEQPVQARKTGTLDRKSMF
jgi:hypothetical protein